MEKGPQNLREIVIATGVVLKPLLCKHSNAIKRMQLGAEHALTGH